MPSRAPADSGGVMRMSSREHEQVLTRALGDESVGREHDRLVVAGLEGLDLGERRVDVVPGGLGGRRHRVVVVAGPRRDLHAHTLGDRVVAEVGAPRPAGDRHVDRARQGVEPHLAVTEVGDRPHVAGGELGRRDRRLGGFDQLVDRVRQLHPEDLGGVGEPHDVVGQAEHGRTFGRLVRTDPLEHAHAVVEGVGEHVHLGFVPVDELAVHPDLRGRGDGHVLILSPGRRFRHRPRWCSR